MMRTAISPRLATRTRAKYDSTLGSSLRTDGPGSERDVAMLLPRVRVALVGEDLERPDQPRPRLARQDDLVDVAAARRDVRVGERLLVRRHQPSPLGRAVVGVRDLVLEDDVD